MKIYVEIPMLGPEMTKEDLAEFATFLESAIDSYGAVPGEYAGRNVGNVRVYKNAADLNADLAEEK